LPATAITKAAGRHETAESGISFWNSRRLLPEVGRRRSSEKAAPAIASSERGSFILRQKGDRIRRLRLNRFELRFGNMQTFDLSFEAGFAKLCQCIYGRFPLAIANHGAMTGIGLPRLDRLARRRP